MKRNLFPKYRKAPFTVVLCSFLLAACVSDEGIEYETPAGIQVHDLHMEIDADGTPVLLVEEGMYYSSQEPPGPWGGKYSQSNIHSIAMTRTSSGWKRHPFRNVLRSYNSRSMLARNAEDRIQILISDRDRLSLYARTDGGWNLKAAAHIPGGYESTTMNMENGGLAFMTDGEEAWQSLIYTHESHRIDVRRKDGTAFALDTTPLFSPLSLVPRKKFNMVFGNHRTLRGSNPPHIREGMDSGNAGESGFFSYSWNVGTADPEPRKRKISERHFNRLFFAMVQGTERVFALAGMDTLAEYSMQGEVLTWLRDIVISRNWLSDSKEEVLSDSGYPAMANLAVDPKGCIHYFASLSGAPAGSAGPAGQPDYIHGSDCRADVDTLKLPIPDTALAYYSRLTPFRFTPAGGIAVGLQLTQMPRKPNHHIDGAARSWVYLATLLGRNWHIEKVLEHEGSGEEERPIHYGY